MFVGENTNRHSTFMSSTSYLISLNFSHFSIGNNLILLIPKTKPYYFSFFFNLTYSRWTSSLLSCLWSQRIFPSLPGSRLTTFYRDASLVLLQLVNQWLNSTVKSLFHFLLAKAEILNREHTFTFTNKRRFEQVIFSTHQSSADCKLLSQEYTTTLE